MRKIIPLAGLLLGLSCFAPVWAGEAAENSPDLEQTPLHICDYLVVPLVRLFEIASGEHPEGATLDQVILPVDGEPQVVAASYKHYLAFFENSPVQDSDALCNKLGL
jgi:hypothetical protein